MASSIVGRTGFIGALTYHVVTKQLELAFAEEAKLPETEQESFAEFFLPELHHESVWQSSFAFRPGVLEFLAAEARADYRAGRTTPLKTS